MSGLHGLSFSGKLANATEKLRELFKHVTVMPIGSGRNALDVIHKGYALLNTGLVVEAGSDDRVLKITGHSFKVGDLIRLQTTSNTINEFEIMVDEIVDADNIKLSGVLSAVLTAGDLIDHLRPISERFGADGSTLATVAPSPVIFDLDGVDTEVKKDTVTPANSRGLPVEIISASGMTINVTTGDVGVQLDHAAATPDSVRVGDGVELLAINAANEAMVHDTDLLAKLDAVLTELQLKADLTETQPVSLASAPLATGAATEAKQDTGNTSLSNIEAQLPATLGQKLKAASLAVALASDSDPLPVTQSGAWDINDISGVISLPTGAANQTKQDTIITNTGNADTKLGTLNTNVGDVTDTAETNPANSGSVLSFLKGIVSVIDTMSAKLPASLGIKTSANSMSVTLASDATLSVNALDIVDRCFVDFSATNITNAGVTAVYTRNANNAKKIHVFLSSETCELYVDGVLKMMVPAGGFQHTVIDCNILGSTIIGLKSKGADATVVEGLFVANFLG